ncbi:MAG: hypothetical protein HOV94_25655, partial [Saccharothrix sp.]|nr:hypothetical protein [Saccharothrix sp.]
ALAEHARHRRPHVVAEALRLGRWPDVVPALLDLHPDAYPVIRAELDAIRR